MKLLSKLSEQDRRALLWLSLFMMAVVFYWGLTSSFDYQQQAIGEVKENRKLQDSLYSHGARVQGLEQAGAKTPAIEGDQSLLAVASGSAKTANLSFKRFQPEGDSELRIWLESVNFNATLIWLASIERDYGIKVDQLSVDKTDKPGLIDARITLIR